MPKAPLAALLAAASLAAPAAAQITVDGTVDAAYGPAVAVQTVNTSFGDAAAADGFGGGGELNAAYAAVEGDRLFVMLTGNVENNFNKLSVFFDTRAGGENVLSGAPAYDFENVSQNFGGLTFDEGFEADLHLYARWGGFTGNIFTVDIVDRDGGAATVRGNGDASSAGGGTPVQTGVVDPTDAGLGSTGVGETRNLQPFLTEPLPFGFNNLNTGGVASGTAAADQFAALAVTTGFEFSVALADLGVTPGTEEIRLHVAYGNSNNNFHSNQFLGPLPGGFGSLGGDNAGMFTGSLSGVDFSVLPGDQFFTVALPSAPLLGDTDGDGDVDLGDLDTLATNFGAGPGAVGGAAIGDFDGDGDVDLGDLDTLATNFGADVTASAVPEPGAAVLVAVAVGLLGGRRR